MSGAGKWFKGLGSSASKAWGNVNATIAKHSKSSYNSAKNWLGKTTKMQLAISKTLGTVQVSIGVTLAVLFLAKQNCLWSC